MSRYSESLLRRSDRALHRAVFLRLLAEKETAMEEAIHSLGPQVAALSEESKRLANRARNLEHEMDDARKALKSFARLR